MYSVYHVLNKSKTSVGYACLVRVIYNKNNFVFKKVKDNLTTHTTNYNFTTYTLQLYLY